MPLIGAESDPVAELAAAEASPGSDREEAGAPPERRWVPLPREALWALPVADTRSSLSRVLVRPQEGGARIDTAIGADFPFLEARFGGWRAQVGLAAGVFMDFDAAGSLTFDLETFDGRFGLPVDVAHGPWSARLELTHLSAHYGDGVRQGEERPTNLDPYSREFVTLQVARTLPWTRVYAGMRALVHAFPEADPWAVQVGVQAAPPGPVAPYLATDLQLADEHDWAPALAAQLGVEARAAGRRLRVGLATRTGPDDTGKREGVNETYLGLMFGFDATGAVVDP